MPVSGVSASGSARKTGQDSAHPGPQSSLAGRHAGLRSSSATGGCPLRPHPGAPGTQGGRTARRGARGGRWSKVPYPRGPPLCKCTEGRGGGSPSKWGAMPTQREALERPLSPTRFHSFPQPPTHLPRLQSHSLLTIPVVSKGGGDRGNRTPVQGAEGDPDPQPPPQHTGEMGAFP